LTVEILSTVLFLGVVIFGQILLLCCGYDWSSLLFPLCLVVSPHSTEMNDVIMFVWSICSCEDLEKEMLTDFLLGLF
jgi:hypothetical protein